MNLYLAGPMTGYLEHNYPAFTAAAKALRELGHVVMSPHETSPCTDHQNPLPWSYYVKRDIAMLVTYCDAIVLLPGYEKSKGAALEHVIAVALGYHVYCWIDNRLEEPDETITAHLPVGTRTQLQDDLHE
jgi:nucleoside 2-deoxyribosyltransferase